MSAYSNAEISSLVKELVSKLTYFKEGSNLFNYVENYILAHIHNADSMVFLKKKDIDRTIDSLSDKFIFHGFSEQAKDLRRHYENFLPTFTPKNETESKLNTVKFLLCLSENPTKRFLESPDRVPQIYHEEEIDWPAYLKEGVERWSPPPSETSESWSVDTKSDISLNDSPDVIDANATAIGINKIQRSDENCSTYSQMKNTLLSSVQYGWFNQERVYALPESTNIDANIAICWDNFVEHSVQGLINIDKSNIITEYCVVREIIWQCWEPHNGFVYKFIGNKLQPKENVTIASVRSMACRTFLHEFLPYIELLDEFKNFDKSLNETLLAPDTYRSYNSSLRNFIRPILKKVVSLEQEIVKQETTITLVKLANYFKDIFRDTNVLTQIHQGVILDFKTEDPVKCATILLHRLHIGLLHCVCKTELDIYLTLYLESLFKYLTIINIWLSNDLIMDVHNEFIVRNTNNESEYSVDEADLGSSIFSENISNHEPVDRQMGFLLSELDASCKDDSFFKIICTDVFQIGKNIHFLRLLKKLYLLGDTLDRDTLYDELITKVLEELSSYFNYQEDATETALELTDEEIKYKFPAMNLDYCKYPTEMDRLENLIDTSDGFLMVAFQSFFTEQRKPETQDEETLYEKISSRTKNMYPAKQIIDTVFSQILRDRYSESGRLVKNIMITDFQVRKHFNMLMHLFLFRDDLIFPLYRRLFVQMMDHDHFDNDIWLTTQLHDIMVDRYPDFYEKCVVKIDHKAQLHDPLKACEMTDVYYFIHWPICFIIKDEHLVMYSELFHLILKVKWALYTLNHLYFNEIEPELSKAKQPSIATYFLRRLMIFRFQLLNEFSNIQHYILGYTFNKYLVKFEHDFDEACNLDMLITSHSDFINSMYTTLIHLRYFNQTYGLDLLLYIVRKLQVMWKDPKNVNEEKLGQYEVMFKECVSNLESIIFPRDMMDM